MAWTTPRTWVTGETVTSAHMNTHVRDNLEDLHRRTTAVPAFIATSEPMAGTSYQNLATIGPAVSAAIGSTGKALVSIYAHLENDTAGQASSMSYEIKNGGAVVYSPSGTSELMMYAAVSTQKMRFGATFLHSGLPNATLDFTTKYKVTGGTGTFRDRWLMVTPLGS